MAGRARQQDDKNGRAERAREVGLFRYALIREAADPSLSTKQRGRLVRDLAEREHTGPFGQRVQVSRVTLDRWILSWRRGGFDALLPSTRYCDPRTSAAVLELAAALKREVPARTAAQVTAILLVSAGSGAPPRRRGRCSGTLPAWSWAPAPMVCPRGLLDGSRPLPRTTGGPAMPYTAR